MSPRLPGHRAGVLCHAGRPLGLRLSDRRRGGVRSRPRRRRFRRRRRLRHLLRRAHDADRAVRLADIVPVQKSLADSLFRANSGRRRQQGRDHARCDRDGCDACWAAPAGRSSAAGARRAISNASRNDGHDGRRRAGVRLRARQGAAAPRDGHARLRQPLSRGPGGRRNLRCQRWPASSGSAQDDVVVTIHCGSRGLGHQIGTEFLKEMVVTARRRRHRASRSRTRLRADQFGGRPALSRRDARGDQLRARQPRNPRPLTPGAFSAISSRTATCACFSTSRTTPARSRRISVDGKRRDLFVHRKGATRAFGPGHPEPARGAARGRPAGADRRQHGDRLVHSGRRSDAARRRRFPRPVMAPAARCRRHAALRAVERPQDRRRSRGSQAF